MKVFGVVMLAHSILIENTLHNIFYFFGDRPQCNTAEPLKALVFDSTFDHYRGVVANIALFGGEIAKGQKIVSAHTKKRYEVNEVGILTPDEQPTHKL